VVHLDAGPTGPSGKCQATQSALPAYIYATLGANTRHLFSVADAAQVLARVVARDRSLVHKHVLFGVVAIDKAVAVLHVKPLHRSDDLCQYNLHTRLRKMEAHLFRRDTV